MALLLGFSTVPSSSLRGSLTTLHINHTKSRNCTFYRRRIQVIKAEVSFVNGDEAKKLVAEEGYTVLDVRDKTQYDRAHIKSSYHVPLFIENTDNDVGTIVKRTLHNNFSGLFYGLPFTKPNPDFVQAVRGQFSADRKLLLVCQEGLRLLLALVLRDHGKAWRRYQWPNNLIISNPAKREGHKEYEMLKPAEAPTFS